MFDHVGIHVADLAASRAFYRDALGLPTVDGEFTEWGDFGIVEASDEHPLTRRLQIAFGVENRDAVDAWCNRLIEAGYESDGGFIIDPDGNSVKAVHHETSRVGEIDQLWLRTRDVSAARRFYEAVAPVVGITLRDGSPDRVQFSDGRGSFSFVAGDDPTQNVHLAFGVPDFGTVARFHEAAIAAGYRDNGPPGERPQYHPGYYGAFVLDADSHNVEAVFHDRC